MLTESDLKVCEKKLALPAGWLSTLLAQFGPIVVQALMTFLQSLLTPAPTPANQGIAKTKCCPEHLACLEAVIGKETEALVALVKFRDCCCE